MTPNAFGTACKAGGARKALQALALFTATPRPSPPTPAQSLPAAPRR